MRWPAVLSGYVCSEEAPAPGGTLASPSGMECMQWCCSPAKAGFGMVASGVMLWPGGVAGRPFGRPRLLPCACLTASRRGSSRARTLVVLDPTGRPPGVQTPVGVKEADRRPGGRPRPTAIAPRPAALQPWLWLPLPAASLVTAHCTIIPSLASFSILHKSLSATRHHCRSQSLLHSPPASPPASRSLRLLGPSSRNFTRLNLISPSRPTPAHPNPLFAQPLAASFVLSSARHPHQTPLQRHPRPRDRPSCPPSRPAERSP